MAAARPVLAVDDLSVDIDVPSGTLHAVSGVSLSIARGRTLCLVGESGCGKSMTALAIMRLLPRRARLSAARIAVAGEEVMGLGGRALARLRGRRMAMIFQDPMTALNPVYTVRNQMTEAFVRHGLGSARQAEERAVALLERVGVVPAADRLAQYPHQLSGGLRQRVMIAMALMTDPALLIADEPTTALDVTVQVQILGLLRDLQREFDLALLLITHNLGVVARMADEVCVMYAGRIVETGAPADIFARPLHPYTQGLLRCVPTPGRTRRGAPLGAIPGMVPSLIGAVRGCQFRGRCRHAQERCASDGDTLRAAGPGRSVRCVLDPEASLARYLRESAA